MNIAQVSFLKVFSLALLLSGTAAVAMEKAGEVVKETAITGVNVGSDLVEGAKDVVVDGAHSAKNAVVDIAAGIANAGVELKDGAVNVVSDVAQTGKNVADDVKAGASEINNIIHRKPKVTVTTSVKNHFYAIASSIKNAKNDFVAELSHLKNTSISEWTTKEKVAVVAGVAAVAGLTYYLINKLTAKKKSTVTVVVHTSPAKPVVHTAPSISHLHS